MKNGNALPQVNSIEKKTHDYTMFGERLEQLRVLTALRMGGKCTQKQFASILGVSEKTYRNWLKGKTPELDNLLDYCDFFNVSLDYLLGRSHYTSVSNELVGEEYKLSDKALNGIKRLNKKEDDKLAEYGLGYSLGIKRTYTGSEKKLIDFLLSTPTFDKFLDNLLDYIFSDIFTIPVFYDDKSGLMKAPNDKYSRYNEQPVLRVASNPKNPNDFKSIPLNSSFFERVAKDKMNTNLEQIKNEYIEHITLYHQVLEQKLKQSKKEKPTKK